MANSAILGIATAGIALALTAFAATPSVAMSFSDYGSSFDNSSASLGDRAEVSQLFSGRLTAEENRRIEHADALRNIREGRTATPSFSFNGPLGGTQRPLSLTLPF